MTGTVNLYHVYFGKFDSKKSDHMKNLMDYFGKRFSTLSWFGVLSEYYQIDNKGIKTFAANSTRFVRSALYKSTSKEIKVNDYDMIDSIQWLINNRQLPADPNGIYVVMFRGDFEYDGWLDYWCAKHDYFPFNDMTLKYAVVGDPSTSGVDQNSIRCATIYSPNGNTGADSMITYYAHEIAEAITDPLGTAWNFGRNNGYIKEIADKCQLADLDSTLIGNKTVLVQQIYRRGVGCVMSSNSVEQAAESVAVHRDPLHQLTAFPVLLPTVAPNRNFDVSYHAGGAIMTGGVTLVNVFLGNFSSQSVGLVSYFSAHIGGSSWYDVLTSYYQLDGTGRQSFVSRVVSFSNSSTAMLMSTTRAAVLTDGDIQLAILRVITTSPAAMPIPNAIYMVMFRGDFNVSYGGKHWLVDWCSYHATMTLPGGYVVRYAVIGDPSTVARGQNGAVCEPIYGMSGQSDSSLLGTPHSKGRGSARVTTANGDLGGDSMVVSYAQQLANIVTDFRGAWYSDQDGSEAGSACWRWGGPVANNSSWNIQLKDKRFLVPQLWQSGRGCTLVKL